MTLTATNPVFKVTAFLKLNIGKKARVKDKVTIAQEETIHISKTVHFRDKVTKEHSGSRHNNFLYRHIQTETQWLLQL